MNDYMVTVEVSIVVQAEDEAAAQESAYAIFQENADSWPFVTASVTTVEHLPAEEPVLS